MTTMFLTPRSPDSRCFYVLLSSKPRNGVLEKHTREGKEGCRIVTKMHKEAQEPEPLK